MESIKQGSNHEVKAGAQYDATTVMLHGFMILFFNESGSFKALCRLFICSGNFSLCFYGFHFVHVCIGQAKILQHIYTDVILRTCRFCALSVNVTVEIEDVCSIVYYPLR